MFLQHLLDRLLNDRLHHHDTPPSTPLEATAVTSNVPNQSLEEEEEEMMKHFLKEEGKGAKGMLNIS